MEKQYILSREGNEFVIFTQTRCRFQTL